MNGDSDARDLASDHRWREERGVPPCRLDLSEAVPKRSNEERDVAVGILDYSVGGEFALKIFDGLTDAERLGTI